MAFRWTKKRIVLYIFISLFMVNVLNNVILVTDIAKQFMGTAAEKDLCLVDQNSDSNDDAPWDKWVDRWQIVIPGKAWVYSAYLDERDDNHYIQITAIAHRKQNSKPIECVVWQHNRTQPSIISANIELLPEQSGRNCSYVAVVYRCTLDKNASIPYVVSVKSSGSDTSNMMHIHRNKPKDLSHHKPKYEFTVCLGGPLKFGLKNVHRLTEWFELNSMFGAQQFILYNHSASSELKPYINYYLDDRKLIQWLPWQFPEAVVTKEKMKNHGHMSLVYDCMYRAMYKSRYVVYMDTDEFIVPRYKNISKWIDLLKVQQCENKSFISFQNVFFKLEWMDDPNSDMDTRLQSYPLVTQLKTKREQRIHPHAHRSKYMIRPELIQTPGIHLVWRWKNKSVCQVDKSRAMLHHYRDWQDPKPGWIEDKFMYRYRDQLLDRVKCVHEHNFLEYEKLVNKEKR